MDTTLTLNVKADVASAASAFEKMASATDKAGKSVKGMSSDLTTGSRYASKIDEEKYQQRLHSRIESFHTSERLKQDLAQRGIGVDQQPGLSAKASLALGKAAAVTGVFVGAVAAANRALEAFAANAAIQANSDLSANQRRIGGLQHGPLGLVGRPAVATARYLHDTMNPEINEALRKQLNQIDIAQATRSAQLTAWGRKTEAILSETEARERARATTMHSGSAATAALPSLGTVAGDRQYQERQIQQPAIEAAIRAQRGLTTQTEVQAQAQRDVIMHQKQLTAMEREAAALQARVNDLKKREDAGGLSPVAKIDVQKERAQAVIDLQNELALIEKQRQNTEAAINREKESGLALAHADSAVQKANIEMAKSRLSILDQQIGRVQSQTRGWGSMTEVERIAADQASRKFEKAGGGLKGLGSLSPFERSLLERISPDTVGKLTEQLGEQDPRRKALLQRLGDPDANLSLKELREKKVQAQAEINLMVQLDEQKLAEKIAKILGDWIVKLTKLIDQKADAERRRVQADQQGRQANQGL